MKIHQIKVKVPSNNYSIFLGNNILHILPNKINELCPNTKKIALIIDRNIPAKFKIILKKRLKSYKLFFFSFSASEKAKSFKTVNFYLNKLLLKNFNRSDLIISVGGGITGDVVGFVSSVYKRGINFINIPTTLLAQVDASIGGKTGINSKFGKNLIGSFYQPIMVLSDASFLKSLSKKEIICGYAEILKHAIIKDRKFFEWLEKNTKKIFSKKMKEIIYAIKKSCETKIFFVNKDENEKSLRMILNFGHTFAHAIEVKNNYAKNISHGEAVLTGMILAARISKIKRVCNYKTLEKITKIYNDNNLSYTFKQYSNPKLIGNLIPYLSNDKKNNDANINFILLKKIGSTTLPNKQKVSIKKLQTLKNSIAQL